MYQIMLVEDESEVLDAMIEMIDWVSLGFSTPVGCRDGQQAINALEEGFYPDLVITDIRMPVVDGLELSRYLRERQPQTLIIILSGHDEFIYAQQALKLQVHDYILKPVTPRRLVELLCTVRKTLDQNCQNATEAKRVMSDSFLARLFSGEVDGAYLQKGIKLHAPMLAKQYHICCVLDVDPWKENESSHELLQYALHNLIAEMMDAQKDWLVVRYQNQYCVLLFSGEMQTQLRIEAEQCTRQLTRQAEELLDATVSAGIGSVVNTPSQIMCSFRDGLNALSFRFYTGRGSLHFADKVPQKRPVFDFESEQERFLSIQKTLDTEQILIFIRHFFEKIQQQCPAPEECAQYCHRLIQDTLHFVSNFLDEKHIQSLEEKAVALHFSRLRFLPQMEEMFFTFYQAVVQNIEEGVQGNAALLAQQAILYVQAHYTDPDISLQTVTKALAVSSSHFSALFKAETQVTFIEYLTRLRMEKAKQILQYTDRKSYEIAEEVGFSDAHYFSSAFKRYTGMTPKAYRERKYQI